MIKPARGEPPIEASEASELYDGKYLLQFKEDCYLVPLGSRVDLFYLFCYLRLAKRIFFDTPRTWILYEPMDRDKLYF